MKPKPLALWLSVAALSFCLVQLAEAGKLRRLLYYNYPGANITNLYVPNSLGNQTFPSTPDAADFLPNYAPFTVSPPFIAQTSIDIANEYGSLIQGYLTAPETGDYIFWIATDDETELLMTTDPADSLNPAKTNRIAWVPGWSAPTDWTKYPEQQSAPISLEAGKTYYVEIRHKEGTGGDHIVIGWQTPSGLVQRPMPSWYFQPIKYFNPLFLGEPDVEVVAGPAYPRTATDPFIYDGNLAVVYANVNLDQPVTYQWYRGGALIDGATNGWHMFRAQPSDNNAVFSVQVRSGGITYPQTTNQTFPLFVVNDKPTVLSAGPVPQNPTRISVLFSEEVNPQSATNASNYTIPGATVQSASLLADGRTVILQTTLLTPTQVYTLNVSGIQDMANPANTMDPTAVTFIMADGAATFRNWGFSRPDGLNPLRAWSNPGSTAYSYVNNLFIGETNITNTSFAWNLTPARDNFNGQMIGYLTPPETGFYKFAIASDDHSILYIGTSADRASKREICFYDGSTGRWNTGQQLANQQSAPIYLEAGKTYYIEAVHRDGTGGDGVSVFWQTPSGPALPTINQNVQSTTERFLIPPQYLSTYANPPVAGAITYRFWDSLPVDLATLRTWSTNGTVAPSYVNNWFAEERTITTNSFGWNLTPLTDHYMGQVIGYVTAPETGNYNFGIASDDHSVLYLGTTDQRSSKREICNYNGSTGRWNLGAQANQRSGTIALEAGKRYYIEAVWRDGTGGDGVTIAWYTPSMAAASQAWPPNPGNTQSATEPYIIPAAYMSTFNAFGNVFFQQDLPPTFSAAESDQPTLRVVADGSRPYFYSWYKNGALIPGAAGASYTLPAVRQADNNAQFTVVVSNYFSSVTSVVANLTVNADSLKPSVASVGSLYNQVIEVKFSEPVSTGTAGNTANYLLFTSAGAQVNVTGAVLDGADPTHVTLQTAAMPETDLMKLVVQNVADSSAAANVLDPATNLFRAHNFEAFVSINNSQPYRATSVDDQILLTGGGADIWGTADGQVFLYKTITGNFDYKVKGISINAVDQWSKMGLMARASVAAGSRNVYNLFTAPTPFQNTYSAQVRDTTGGASTSSNDAGTPLNTAVRPGVTARPTILPYPSWVRIQRIGNTINYYYGATDANWIFWTSYDSSASAEGALPNTLLVGIALTSHNTAMTADGVLGSFTAINDGPLAIATQPTNTTVLEGGTAVFTVVANGSQPYFYQWTKNNADIAGATTATLSMPRVSFCTDNNAQIVCRVSNGYGASVNSAAAVLTVIPDTTAPTMAFYATPKINLTTTEVRLLFSEWLDPITAQDVNNYKVYNVAGNVEVGLAGATLGSDERTLVLTTAGSLTPGATYRVVVSNVKDLACNPNTIAANSTDYFFCAGTAPMFAQRADGFVLMEAESAQRFTTSVSSPAVDWQLQTIATGYSGAGYMNVTNIGAGGGGTTGISGGVSQGTGAKMEFDVEFTRSATNYTIWIRGLCAPDGQPTGNNDSVYVGIDGNLISIGGGANNVEYSQMTSWGSTTTWDWRSDASAGGDPMVITNVAPGLHTIVIWHREDGTCIDKICLEPGVRSGAGNSTEPTQASGNGGLGDAETWAYIVAPPAAPTISISSPAAGSTFPAGNVAVTATVNGPSPVVRVEFFQGTNLIGTATTSPYTVTWPNVTEGIYSLTARVTDVLGYQVTSAAVQIAEAGALTLSDVTQPGDAISLTAGSSPAAETVTNMINNSTSKCLNYDAVDLGAPFVGPVGFIVTPSAGRSIVSKIRFYTANDAPERDPMNFVLEGSNDGSSWSLITSNLLTLPAGRNAAGQTVDPLTRNVWHVPFANTTEYASYRVQFYDVKNNATANSMQLGEVELLGTVVQPPTLTIAPGTGGSLVITASVPGTLLSTTSLATPISGWVNEGPISGTVTITPTAGVPEKFYRLSVP